MEWSVHRRRHVKRVLLAAQQICTRAPLCEDLDLSRSSGSSKRSIGVTGTSASVTGAPRGVGGRCVRNWCVPDPGQQLHSWVGAQGAALLRPLQPSLCSACVLLLPASPAVCIHTLLLLFVAISSHSPHCVLLSLELSILMSTQAPGE